MLMLANVWGQCHLFKGYRGNRYFKAYLAKERPKLNKDDDADADDDDDDELAEEDHVQQQALP